MRFYSSFSIGDETIPIVLLPSELHWVSVDLMKNMAVGHDVEAITQYFTTMNISDSSALYNAINHAATLGNSLGRPVIGKALTPQKRTSSTSMDNSQHDMDTEESRFWDMETGIASFRTTFDPVSRRRRAVIANARQATFYGAHPEEFQVRKYSEQATPPSRHAPTRPSGQLRPTSPGLTVCAPLWRGPAPAARQARCASRQLPFPFTEMDAVALFHFVAVRQHFQIAAVPELCMRMLTGGR